MRRRDNGANGKAWTTSLNPVVNYEDKGDEVVISAELPGFEDKDIRVEVDGGRLILRGSKRLESEERGDNFYRVAKGMAEFTRMFALPPGIDAQRANAKLKNGMLRVILPKSENAKAKRIQIRAS
jgi:HSP20 family protein